MGDIVKQILTTAIQTADQVIKSADDAQSFKLDCQELKAKTEKLAGHLRQAARSGSDLYERPTLRIVDDTQQVLDKALSLVQKCRANGLMKRLFTIIPATAFKKMSAQLENSSGDVSWLIRVSVSSDDQDDEYLGLPPIAQNEPILCLIWEQIANLSKGSLEDRSDAAASLVSLARDNDRYIKLIIEEGGVVPLLKLVKEGRMEGQESAARAIGLLGRDPESVEVMIHGGVCSVFAKILKDGPMKVQSMVAWAVSELAANYPKCQDPFAQNNIIRLLVSHLAFETVQEHSKYAIANNKAALSIHSVVMASNTPDPNKNNNNANKRNEDPEHASSQIAHPMGNQNPNQMHNLVTNTMANLTKTPSNPSTNPAPNKPPIQNKAPPKQQQQHQNQNHHHQQHISLSGTSIKGREYEDPATKASMKAMAAKALCHLAKGNVAICRSITESRALLCFAVLLEKGPDEVQYNSAMALMEISAVAEGDGELRRSAFKPNTPAAKAVFDQLLRIIKQADSDLLIPSINAMGYLARTFRATETRIIGPLVKLLDEGESEVQRAATISLTKFACTGNFLHVNHSKTIIKEGGVKHLVQLLYLGDNILQISACILLCYIATHVPDNKELAALRAQLDWASKQEHITRDPTVDTLLPEARSRLELYQPRTKA